MVRIWLTNTDYWTCIINVNLSKAKYCCEWSPWVSIDLIASFLCYPDERILRSEWSVSPASPATAHVQSMSSLGQSSQSPQSWQATVPCRFASLSERDQQGLRPAGEARCDVRSVWGSLWWVSGVALSLLQLALNDVNTGQLGARISSNSYIDCASTWWFNKDINKTIFSHYLFISIINAVKLTDDGQN